MTYIPLTYARKEAPASNLLRAIFEYGFVSYKLSDARSLVDLGQQMDRMTGARLGGPVSIDVKFNTGSNDRPLRRPPERRHVRLHW